MLVPAKCTNCGANISVDASKDAAVCEFCGSAFIVEKAVNNFMVENHIQAGVVNIYGGGQDDFVIRAGKLVKYNGASADVVIPGGVTHIGAAFRGCDRLRSVRIPMGVTNICEKAFAGCKELTLVQMPNTVKVIEA